MADHFGRCDSSSNLYVVRGEDALCHLMNGHAGPHQTNSTPDSRDVNIVSWGPADVDPFAVPPTCRARFQVNDGVPWYCVRPENHTGSHQDNDGDNWDITYRGVNPRRSFVPPTIPVQDPIYLAEPDKEQGDYLHGRAHGDLIKELYQRVSALALRTNDLQKLFLALRADNSRLYTCLNEAGHRAGSGTGVLETVTASELASLRKDSEKLNALEAAGVDNWEGYCHAMSILHGDDDTGGSGYGY